MVAKVAAILQLNTKSNVKVIKPQIFNRETKKILGFPMTCRLFIRIRIRNDSVKEQIQ